MASSGKTLRNVQSEYPDLDIKLSPDLSVVIDVYYTWRPPADCEDLGLDLCKALDEIRRVKAAILADLLECS